MSTLFLTPSEIESKTKLWKQDPFYREKIVLGLDIGLRGIGVYLRKGPVEIAAASLRVTLPEAKPLEQRRLYRGSRHARKNLRQRRLRLRALFAQHRLPWADSHEMSKNDPFILRHRAVTKGVASLQALAICIRSCVDRRGYDYDILQQRASGAYPWGDSSHGKDAIHWLHTTYIEPNMEISLREYASELEWKGKDSDKGEASYLAALEAALERSSKQDIEAVLEAHRRSDKHNNLRAPATGYNFPRAAVAAHLRKIIDKHRAMIPDVDSFLEILFLKPDPNAPAAEAKAANTRAIFYYNRKTPQEMKALWDRKRKDCPYFVDLGLTVLDGPRKCGLSNVWPIRKWNLVEFLATRRITINVAPLKKVRKDTTEEPTATGQYKVPVPKAVIALALKLAYQDQLTYVNAGKTVPSTSSKAVFALLETTMQEKYAANKASIVPGTKDQTNEAFRKQLNDLLRPTHANLSGTASLSEASAMALLKLTGLEREELPAHWEPTEFSTSLKASGYYLWKRRPNFDLGVFPQVEKLLGPLKALLKDSALPQPTRKAGGYLGKLFAQHAADLGQSYPDYCIVEVMGHMPRNSKQRDEMVKEMTARRDKRDDERKDSNITGKGANSARRRIQLHKEQRGHCPFTNEELPDPMSSELELEHLFPESLGGLSIENNLVLTRRTTNQDKGQRTPLQWAQATGRDFKAMERFTSSMDWGAKKREIFAWGIDAQNQQGIPDFENTTRMGQLGRQLVAGVQHWMGVYADQDLARQRVATPTGWHTAQARRTWLRAALGNLDYVKDRNHFIHHLLDAAVLAHLPPGTGMNSARCGGIFYTTEKSFPQTDEKPATTVVSTHVLPELLPPTALNHWLPADQVYARCPVVVLSPNKRYQSLGDSTFWRQINRTERTLAQRTPLELGEKKIKDGADLLARLHQMKARSPEGQAQWERNLPDRKTIDAWVAACTGLDKKEHDGIQQQKPVLLLKDGTPLKSIWKFDGKGTLSAVGWSGEPNAEQRLAFLRNLDTKFDRLELWLGYNQKKHVWEYQKRLVPDARCIKGMKRMGISWGPTHKQPAPDWMQETECGSKTAFELISGKKLHPCSLKVGSLQTGDVLEVYLDHEGEIVSWATAKPWPLFYRVSAINGNTQVEMKSLLFESKEGTRLASIKKDWLKQQPADAAKLAMIIGLPPAIELASQRNLKIPPPPPGHDTSPNPPPRRAKRDSSPPGQGSLGFE